jgi:hypothetical protein
VWGLPNLRIGDTLDLVLAESGGGGLLGAATEALSGMLGGSSSKPPYRITGLTHSLNREAGFVTTLELGGSTAPGDIAGGAAGLAGGLP